MKPRKIILRCALAFGDIVMLTASVRDLQLGYPERFQVDVRTPFPALWEHNPWLTHLDEQDPDVEVIEGEVPLINQCNALPHHYLHAFIDFLNTRLGLRVHPTAFHGDLHFSAEEKAWCSQVQEWVGDGGPFWIIAAGGKYDVTVKWWNTERYQAVVDQLRGRIRFVQVGGQGHWHPPLEGVLDLRFRTSLRELLRLVYHSQGVLCPITGLMHLAAAVEMPPGGSALRRPCVVVAGGREPVQWEAYPHHQFIHTLGALACCADGGCWKSRTVPLGDGDERDQPGELCVDVVEDLPRCMHLITPEQVVQRIEGYFAALHRYANPPEISAFAGAVARSRRRDGEHPLTKSTVRMRTEQFLKSAPPYPGGFRGRGIVICAGGQTLFTSAWVCLRLLRQFGCDLPVQFWHLGPGELDDAMRRLVAPFGVECVDAHEVRKQHPARILRGWPLKAYALKHCPYEEVILLDADNVPLTDPTFLFETSPYREEGAVFWPDYGEAEPAREVWDFCGIPYRQEPGFESGQIVLNKKRCWSALQLALWYNEHSDFFYQHIHGDKETFHLAWRKLAMEFAMPMRRIENLGGLAMAQHDFDGRRIFQHRNLDKWQLDGANTAIEGFEREVECRAWVHSLHSQWDGCINGDDTKRDRAVTPQEWLTGDFRDHVFALHRVGVDDRVMTFLANGMVGEGYSAETAYWKISTSNGRPALEIASLKGHMTRLSPDDQKVWRGNWLRGDGDPVEIYRLCRRTTDTSFRWFPPPDQSEPGSVVPKLRCLMMTCPARERLRHQTLANLRGTDWNERPVLVQLDRGISDSAAVRMKDNMIQTLQTALGTDGDLFLVLEDDLEFNQFICANLLQWEPLRTGVISLATLYNPGLTPCWDDPARHCRALHPYGMWGSQALLISRPAAEYFLEHFNDDGFRDLPPDLSLPRMAARLGPVYGHRPSLVEHVGDESTWGGRQHRAIDFMKDWRNSRLPSPGMG